MKFPFIVINVVNNEPPVEPQPELSRHEKFMQDFDRKRKEFHDEMDNMFK